MSVTKGVGLPHSYMKGGRGFMHSIFSYTSVISPELLDDNSPDVGLQLFF